MNSPAAHIFTNVHEFKFSCFQPRLYQELLLGIRTGNATEIDCHARDGPQAAPSVPNHDDVCGPRGLVAMHQEATPNPTTKSPKPISYQLRSRG